MILFYAFIVIVVLLITGAAKAEADHRCFNTQIPGFVENTGLVRDPEGKSLWEVQYLFTSKGFHLALHQRGFSVEWLHFLPSPQVATEDCPDDGSRDLVLVHRVDFRFAGSAPKWHWKATGKRVSEVHCYQNTLPHGGYEHVGVFDEVTCRNVYPGIDLFFRYDHEGGLRYGFLVHPGADGSCIVMSPAGAEKNYIAADGSWQVHTGIGWLSSTKPIIIRLSDRKPIASAYVLDKKGLRFSLDRRALKGHAYVIDPTVIWGSLIGGTQNEFAGEIAGDNKSKAILSGATSSTTFIATAGAYQTVYGGGELDIFCAKFRPQGSMEWSTYFGGSKKEVNYGMALDYSTANNSILLFGNSTSTSGVTTAGAHQETLAGKGDVLITKFNGNGTLSWSTFFGGPLQEHSRQGVVDAKGDIYITGPTKSLSGIATPGSAFPTYQGGDGDAYVAKFSKNGKLLWASYIGGDGNDRFHSICLDKSGNIYLHGTTDSKNNLATPGVHQTNFAGHLTDCFLTRFDTTGNFYWTTYYGGSGEDHGRGVAADGAGNVYICGYIFSPDGIAYGNAIQNQWYVSYNDAGDPQFDGYVAKFNPSGHIIWGTYYGGDENDILNALDLDQQGKLYAIGKTRSKMNVASSNALQQSNGGGMDGLIVKLDTAGTLIWGTYVGGAKDDGFNNGRFGPDNKLYLAVDTYGGIPLTPGAYLTTAQGSSEAAALVLDVQDNCYDRYEPNETSLTGAVLSTYSDTSLYGYSAALSSATDVDWFRINVSTSTNLKIRLRNLTEDYDLKFYNKNGLLLFSSVNSGTTEEVIVYNSAPKSSYFIEVTKAGQNFDTVQCYRLDVWSSSSPWREGSLYFNSDGTVGLTLTPVPAADHVRLLVRTLQTQKAFVSITDVFGRVVWTRQVEPSNGSVETDLDVSTWPQGTYVVRFQQGSATLVGRLIVAR
ncbi:MAG: SBBP repeat-containing protein [Chitinophagales bacterium]|nr:SBBP repeat-containing protein [Chitinophagales bacterium]MDW8427327.1 SBBP repeat-containing protein [Chitinophagales bacterium]